jgi:hypothetical protein
MRLYTLILFACLLLSSHVQAQYTISGPQCITHVTSGTPPTYTFTATGSHVQGTPVWSTRGEIQIVSQTTSPLTVTVRSTGFGKGRVVLVYNQSTICGGNSASKDVYKTFPAQDQIIGPSCVRPGESATFSIKPIVSSASQIQSEVGVDQYFWKINGLDLMQEPNGWDVTYTSGDSSSITVLAPADLSGPQILTVAVGQCNEASTSSLSLSTKANVPVFVDAPATCRPANSTASFTMKVIAEPGVSYSWTGPTGWSISPPTTAGGFNQVTVTPNNSGGDVTVRASASDASCESSVNSMTFYRELVSGFNTITVAGNPSCFTVNTAYTFSLAATTATPTNNGTYIWTAPPGWTPSTITGGTSATFTPGAAAQPGNVTVKSSQCQSGVITFTPIVSNNQGLTFTLEDLECGLFRVSAPGFVRTGATYSWSAAGQTGTTTGNANSFTFNPWTGSTTVSVRITKLAPSCLDATATLTNWAYNCPGLLASSAARSATGKEGVLAFFPNPGDTQVTITLPENDQVKNVTITDQQGRERKRFNTIESSHTVDISALPEGVYVVTVFSGKEKLVKKLLIER